MSNQVTYRMTIKLTRSQLKKLEPVLQEVSCSYNGIVNTGGCVAQIFSDGMRVAFLPEKLMKDFQKALGSTGTYRVGANTEAYTI